MPGVYIGDTKSLVFPVMCDGFLKQTYLNYNAADTAVGKRQGIWGLSSFTLEAIITPYDVNGYGTKSGSGLGIIDSEKTPPSLALGSSAVNHYQSYQYFLTNRLTHKMMLFYNSNFQLYLQNTAGSNINKPAEYKLVAEFADGSANVESDVIISGTNALFGYPDVNGLYNGTTTSLRKISSTATNVSPWNTITISSNSLPVNVIGVAATGTVTLPNPTSGTDAYYPEQNAIGSITLVSNTMSVDTYPVGEIAKVKFGAIPSVADGSQALDCVQITPESGSPMNSFFCYGSGSDGQALIGGNFPANSYRFLQGGTVELTVANLARAINAVSGALGENASATTSEANPVLGGATLFVCTLPAEIQGTTPNRLGITSAVCALGSYFSANHSEVYANDFTGGINEVVVANNYFTITDSTSSSKKYHPYPDVDSAPATGTTATRGADAVTAFRVKTTLTGTIQQLSSAINHNTNGNAGATSLLADGGAVAINITNDAAGTAGNSSTITKTNIANGIATYVDFAGGEAANQPTKYITLEDSDGTTTKFHPTHYTKATQSTGDSFSYGGNTYIAWQAQSSGGQEWLTHFKLAVNSVSALDMTAADAVSTTITLTQGVEGADGNTDIDSTMSAGSDTNFANGADTSNPTNYIALTDASGTLRKYKASTIVTETTGSTDGTYIFFAANVSVLASANNLVTAINGSSGHNGNVTATNPANNGIVKVQVGGVSNYALTENITGVSVGSWDTSETKNISLAANEANNIGAKEEIYNDSGTLIGITDTAGGNIITLEAVPATPVTSIVYASQPREAMFTESMIKIGCTVHSNGSVKLFANNNLVKQQKITITNTSGNAFIFDPSDCYIGQNGSNKNTQFMGELYEISMFKRTEPTPNSSTLNPGFNDIVFYYRFGDN